ncbi:MAG: TetR/AcrR family transcriptional regulator [Cumulibacter sp.]
MVSAVRADAQANRAKIIDAALQLYAERGDRPPMSTVAHRAGVGIATLYRNFADPRALERALLQSIAARIIAVCERGAVALDTSPEEGWRRFATEIFELRLGSVFPVIADLRQNDDEFMASVSGTRRGVIAAITQVVDRAKSHGLVDKSVDPFTFQVGLGLLSRPIPALVLQEIPDLESWLVRVYLAGIRPR